MTVFSDSGTTSMTDTQWSAMFLADESYGRNKGYYVLLDAFRDVWEEETIRRDSSTTSKKV